MSLVSPNHTGEHGSIGAAIPATTQSSPVIVLSSPDSGGQRLLSLLAATGELACTAGTGVLPLCDQATQTWRRVENGGPQGGRLSVLAVKSIRASITPLIMHILAGANARRWCECAAPSRETAEAFLSVFPGTRFVCLHREVSEVIRAVLARSQWGIAGQPYRPFVAAHPGSTVAALAAYWAAHTEALLAFEADHPDECLRVRFEDLPGPAGDIPAPLSAFPGLNPTLDSGLPAADPSASHADPQPPVALPVDQFPPALLAQVNSLLGQIGYPHLAKS